MAHPPRVDPRPHRPIAAATAAALLVVGCASLPVQDVHPLCGTGAQRTTYYCPDTYVDYAPPVGSIVGRTARSGAFELYGTVGAADENANGIADRREDRLMELAIVFSPILVKNNRRGVPWSIEDAMRLEWTDDLFQGVDCRGRPELIVDRWNLAGERPERVSSTIRLGPASGMGSCAPEVGSASGVATLESLEELYREFGPRARRVPPDRPARAAKTVLYVDFPGYHEDSWRVAYRSAASILDPHVYVHFFLEPVSGSAEDPEGRSRLIIQYWFFYPHNDGGNNHEGDWEHINVHVGREHDVPGSLRNADLRALLAGGDGVFETLEIAKVDYYFHRFVHTLDYQRPRSLFPDTISRVIGDWNWIPEQIEHRKNKYGTHPLAYIGADNNGLDQAFTAGGDRNRNSHGTYPFFGTWKRIGPFGATERIHRKWDERTERPTRRPWRGGVHESGGPADSVPTWEELASAEVAGGTPGSAGARGSRFVRLDSERNITLVPDFEDVERLVVGPHGKLDGAALRDWFWLLLPLRWGFPVTEWAGGGIAAGADNGQAAPVGPAFNTGWNRTGPSAGYARYEPYVFPEHFGMGFQDNFHTRAGWRAYPAALRDLVILPIPLHLTSYLRRLGDDSDPKFLPRAYEDSGRRRTVPFNAISIASHPFRSFWRGDAGIVEKLGANDPGGTLRATILADTRPVDGSVRIDRGTSPFGFTVGVHAGRFTTRLGGFYSEARTAWAAVSADGSGAGLVSATRRDWLVTATYRHRFLQGGLSPYVAAGYGYHYWRVDDFRLEGEVVPDARTRWFGPSWLLILPLPNTTHFGGGLEWFPWPGYAANAAEVGLHAESMYRGGSLGRFEVGGGLTLSF